MFINKKMLVIIITFNIIFLVMIIDYCNIKNDFIINQTFNVNKWKSKTNRVEMLKDIIINYNKVLNDEKMKKEIFGNEDFLNTINPLSISEKYKYRIKGYKIYDKGIIFRKKIFFVFDKDYCVISEEIYVLSYMIPYFDNIYDCKVIL